MGTGEQNNNFSKYARLEVERKFVLAKVPPDAPKTTEISDLYITNSTLRLREEKTETLTRYKLGQKVRSVAEDPQVVMHTNLYLNEREKDLMSKLPGKRLSKTRYSMELKDGLKMSIDKFRGSLAGLVIGEVDFGSDGEPASFQTPSIALAEVTTDERFTGGALASMNRASLSKALKEVSGIKIA